MEHIGSCHQSDHFSCAYDKIPKPSVLNLRDIVKLHVCWRPLDDFLLPSWRWLHSRRTCTLILFIEDSYPILESPLPPLLLKLCLPVPKISVFLRSPHFILYPFFLTCNTSIPVTFFYLHLLKLCLPLKAHLSYLSYTVSLIPMVFSLKAPWTACSTLTFRML